MPTEKSGAEALVQTMINHGVKFVFGLPGAKVDKLFDILEQKNIKDAPQLIITRHEQNAAFMAGAIGRITGNPGVVAVTSGPGVANLATGLVTATSEGDPIVAIGGQVTRDDLVRRSHQSIANKELLSPLTKMSAEIEEPNNLSETFANAYQMAKAPKSGASFISIPQDVMDGKVTRPEIKSVHDVAQGIPAHAQLKEFADRIKNAKMPVILAGMRASEPRVAFAMRNLLKKVNIPVVETFQGAGIISHDLIDNFYGRVGLFRNQTGDILLNKSDLVITIGYDPIEYEARNWNRDREGSIINLDNILPEISTDYQPDLILRGDLADTLDTLTDQFTEQFNLSADTTSYLNKVREDHKLKDLPPVSDDENLVHPLTVIKELQERVADDTTVTVDVGSNYIWMARHFKSYEPRKLLFSNGMQTLGVSLPWAISAALLNPKEKVISVSGDAGFMFSSAELATAVQHKLNIIHLVWNDGYYDMVKFQAEAKYGKASGVKVGGVDFAKYAESFGAKGITVDKDHDIASALDEAFKTDGPVVIDIPIDYRNNSELNKQMIADSFY
ncbi:acetolactate synthase [Companilactobacillus sp. RD055328]|uniref:acetolactate synthase AlsS n=1 Tax=Companilactobacillus sp. RD055328 TaxID=2916634 RepID=UPI001FC8D493|nr:acetolactate synthase AlsS [Companilactobacillus sp. RD055328]GKQ42360.1 acetolactate synthase [Companilactobacillus sp. RD055328]